MILIFISQDADGAIAEYASILNTAFEETFL